MKKNQVIAMISLDNAIKHIQGYFMLIQNLSIPTTKSYRCIFDKKCAVRIYIVMVYTIHTNNSIWDRTVSDRTTGL